MNKSEQMALGSRCRMFLRGTAKIYTGNEIIQSMMQQVFELFRCPFLFGVILGTIENGHKSWMSKNTFGIMGGY